jgi:hypothetical protein
MPCAHAGLNRWCVTNAMVQIGKFNHLYEKTQPDNVSRDITAADEQASHRSGGCTAAVVAVYICVA